MKFTRIVTAFLILIIVICGALILSGKIGFNESGSSFSGGASETKTGNPGDFRKDGEAADSTAAAPASAEDGSVSSVKVTVASLAGGDAHLVEFLGTVKANDQIKVFATSAGQLRAVYAQEGSTVNAGDPLFLIGGLNGAKAAAQIQMEVAQINYGAALKGLEITQEGNAASLRAAQLQLESARHQADGYGLDMQVFDQNIGAARTGQYFLRDSYNATAIKNSLDLEKTQNGIDELKNSIDNLEIQKARLERMEGQDEAVAEMDKTIEELYGQLETAKIGFQTLEQAKVLTENQLLGQIAASESQGKVLYLNQLSLQSKLGLTGGHTDAVKLAEAGLSAAEIKNKASLLQAQTQLDLAKSNLELARIQADGLIVKAMIKGTVGEILARPGDIVSQQSMLTQILGLADFELRAAVDQYSADMINPGSLAEVEIRGRIFKLPVKSVGVAADPATRLVNVTVALPRVLFRANQTLRVKLPLETGANNRMEDGSVPGSGIIFAPLDAVIIGTEEQYVFTAENGRAVKKNIVTGEVRGDLVRVLEGLSATDRVIVEGAKTLMEGQKIDIQ